MNSDSEKKGLPRQTVGRCCLRGSSTRWRRRSSSAKLRSSGIEAYAKHDALSVVYGLTVDGCGQQDIMVRAEDLEEARMALEVVEEPDSAE